MKSLLLPPFGLALIALLLIATPASFAQMDGAESLHLPDLIVRGAYYDVEDGSIIMSLYNPHEVDLILFGFTSPFGESLSFVDAEGEPVADGVILRPSESLEIGPDTYSFILETGEAELPAAFPLTLMVQAMTDGMEDEMGDEMPAMFDGLYEQPIALPVLSEAPNTLPLDFRYGWARDNFPNSAAYVEITNTSAEDDYVLVNFTTNGAEFPEIHDVQMSEDGTMQMRPIESLSIPAGETVALRPGGYHLMLIGVTDRVIEGNAIVITLEFENGESTTIALPVFFENPYAEGMEMGDMQGME